MINGMREIEYFSIGTKKRLVYQIRIDEDTSNMYMSWTSDGLPGTQMQVRGFPDMNRLEEELRVMHDRLISVGYTQVPFGYTEQMNQFDNDIQDMKKAESGVR